MTVTFHSSITVFLSLSLVLNVLHNGWSNEDTAAALAVEGTALPVLLDLMPAQELNYLALARALE